MPSRPKPLEKTTVCDHDEIMLLLSAASRLGNVVAMRTLLEELRRDRSEDTAETVSVLDELAAKRTKTAAG